MNLVINAANATRGEGTLRIATCDPFELTAFDELRLLTGMGIPDMVVFLGTEGGDEYMAMTNVIGQATLSGPNLKDCERAREASTGQYCSTLASAFWAPLKP